MTLQLKVPNIPCSGCRESITKAVKTIAPAAIVQSHTKTQAAEVAITEAITGAGYTVTHH
ncbi:heavy-metal-associated domain-containing protein [Chlorogloeopsis sp. ULAP02]|uniref:heavy-metal-associated domain-containing protein n=1 Tax=Chlorogloeopsis sp. ULAP02 TaxID=3107926 RepID=UPI0031348ADF